MLKLSPTISLNKLLKVQLSGAFLGSILIHIVVFLIFSSAEQSQSIQPERMLHATLVTYNIPSTELSNQQTQAEEHTFVKRDTQAVENSSVVDTAPYIEDSPAKLVKLADLELPAVLQSISGLAVIDVLVDERGKIETISIQYASPEGVLDEYIQTALLKSEIKPAYHQGKPVKQHLLIEIKLSTDGTLGIGSK